MKIKKYKLNIFFATVLMYILYVFFTSIVDSYLNRFDLTIGILSWVGLGSYIIFILLWKRITGKLITLYNIFLSFFLIFNFGQCLLWAFNVHVNGEIGTSSLYGKVLISNSDIIRAQLLYIICFFTLNCGALIAYKTKNNSMDLGKFNNTSSYNKLYITSAMLSFIVIPVTYYIAIYNLILAQTGGYRSLYYGENAGKYGPIINIIGTMFLPCLIGLLLGSKYRKNVRVFVYGIFGGYAILTLLCGDRGEWIMKLLVLFWADNYFYRKRSIKQLATLGGIGYIGVCVMNAIVSLRNIGLSWEGFINALFSAEMNPIVSLLKEFGNSMSVNIVVMKNNIEFPYGNSYLMSILTTPSTSLSKLFGMDYEQLNTWFSGTYLGISYGADFTIIAEAVLNYGIYISPFILLIIGYIVSRINMKCEVTYKDSPVQACLMISVMSFIFKWPRTTTWYVLNSSFYSIVIILFVYCFISITTSYKKPTYNKYI